MVAVSDDCGPAAVWNAIALGLRHPVRTLHLHVVLDRRPVPVQPRAQSRKRIGKREGAFSSADRQMSIWGRGPLHSAALAVLAFVDLYGIMVEREVVEETRSLHADV